MTMMLLVISFIAAMLFLLAVAENDHDPDADFAEEAETRRWIDHLAKRSLRREKRSRGRHSRAGHRLI